MTLDGNLNPHEEIKSTSKGIYAGKHKRECTYFFFSLKEQLHKTVI